LAPCQGEFNIGSIRTGNFTPVGQINPAPNSLPVQPPLQKYFGSLPGRNIFKTAPSRPKEGRFAIVTDAGRDAMDADVLLTNSA
jgi:hypothetical protein